MEKETATIATTTVQVGNPNLLDAAVRKKIIDEIKGQENVRRKMNEQRKFDIYRKRQAGYVIERLRSEFDVKTVNAMRKVLSINPCKRIVDEQASLYVEEPERHFSDANDEEKDQIKEIYECGKIDPQLRLANRYYKLHGQSALYVLPKGGKIVARALTPKDYDVVPDVDDPEKAFAYVLNVFDPLSQPGGMASNPVDWSDNRYSQSSATPINDRKNQTIADANDRSALAGQRFVFWTDELHLTCDGNGELISGKGNNKNPIGELPFIDIANEKDFQFFVQVGSDVTDFVIDFLTQLSDLANTCRLQNYSQATISSVNPPTNVEVGPNKVLWLQVDPNADIGTRPEFAYTSPSPDIMGSLEFLNAQLKMFLSSVGLNPGTVSGKNEMEKFTSGIDHLLANLDKFKASKEDMDIFRDVENQLFDLIRDWQEVMFDVTDDEALDDELKATRLSEEIKLDMAYHEPQAVMTQTETEDSVIKLRKEGLMTKVEAVKRIYGVEKDKAEEIVAELDAEKAANAASGLGPDGLPLPVQVDPLTGEPITPEPGPDGKPMPPKMGPDGKPMPPAKGLPNGNKAPDAIPAKGEKLPPGKEKPDVKGKAKGKKPPFPPKGNK
jgi:hypothetical protein